uniref:Old yellow enzyme OYE5 n=1 Tax=Achromobacter sp. JA81 TaxID=1109013 RepID=I3V5V7_9BURK|nr:old yellow enzyme OYE5 [Achromobacter sp. JA81]
MSQYSAVEGKVQPWHREHTLAQARGGAAAFMVEASAVTRDGRGTWGDLGIWNDNHIEGLRELADIIARQGAIPAIQIGHAGRKASTQRPWEGNRPLAATHGDEPAWPTLGADAIPIAPGMDAPRRLDADGLAGICGAFAAAARRAAKAGYRMVEVHAAHGYLLHSFLSPLSNRREDEYGGSLENRMRFPLAVVRAVRDALPADCVLSVRISAVDGASGGWTLADSIELARRFKALGVDIVDCSSGGILGPATASTDPQAVRRGPGFQVPFANAVKHEAGIPTLAVGLIVQASQAQAILAENKADLIAIGRQALVDPHWPLRARRELGLDPDYAAWPRQYGWWLARRPETGPQTSNR